MGTVKGYWLAIVLTHPHLHGFQAKLFTGQDGLDECRFVQFKPLDLSFSSLLDLKEPFIVPKISGVTIIILLRSNSLLIALTYIY